jgi:hypothetical protein
VFSVLTAFLDYRTVHYVAPHCRSTGKTKQEVGMVSIFPVRVHRAIGAMIRRVERRVAVVSTIIIYIR